MENYAQEKLVLMSLALKKAHHFVIPMVSVPELLEIRLFPNPITKTKSCQILSNLIKSYQILSNLIKPYQTLSKPYI